MNPEYDKGYQSGYEAGYKRARIDYGLESDPCPDCVSREAAVMAMREIQQEDIETYGCKIPEGFDATEAIKALMALPPVTPARERNYKVYLCRKCKIGMTVIGEDTKCPHCGAEMEGANE